MAAHNHYSGTTPFLQGLNDEQQKSLKALTKKTKLWNLLYTRLCGYHTEATPDSVRELANTRLFHRTTEPLDPSAEPLDPTEQLDTTTHEPLEYPAVDASREAVLFYYDELLYQHRCKPRVEVIFLLGALCNGPHKSVLPAPVSGKRTDQLFTEKDQRDAKRFHHQYVDKLPAIAQWAIENDLPHTYLRERQLLYYVHALWSGTHTHVSRMYTIRIRLVVAPTRTAHEHDQRLGVAHQVLRLDSPTTPLQSTAPITSHRSHSIHQQPYSITTAYTPIQSRHHRNWNRNRNKNKNRNRSRVCYAYSSTPSRWPVSVVWCNERKCVLFWIVCGRAKPKSPSRTLSQTALQPPFPLLHRWQQQQ
mmetsp:Transcript_39705/g.100025  ORF Transcript_39705/g.100025 Transcript_39705/m.100025 type:complete len:361 (+) Transcript_39705:166-1248(+)